MLSSNLVLNRLALSGGIKMLTLFCGKICVYRTDTTAFLCCFATYEPKLKLVNIVLKLPKYLMDLLFKF